MRPEILYGLVAAISWSIYVILLKISLKDLPLKIVLPLMGLGVFVTSLISVYLFNTHTQTNYLNNKLSLILAILSGVVWFLGILSVNYAMKKGYNLSIMAPIYNLNTLFVVLLSLIILKESVDPSKVILASILVTIATILLSI